MKRLQQIEELPAAEQRAVLKMVDALFERDRATPPIAAANAKPDESTIGGWRRSPVERPTRPDLCYSLIQEGD
jgi:hypothetical protein